jgi:hypothetical protein
MTEKALQEKKLKLVKRLEKCCDEIIPGSLNEQKVNCGRPSCKKCEKKQKGHIAFHLSYYSKNGKRKNVYAPIEKIKEIQNAQKLFVEAKVTLGEIAEINLQMLKARRKV